MWRREGLRCSRWHHTLGTPSPYYLRLRPSAPQLPSVKQPHSTHLWDQPCPAGLTKSSVLRKCPGTTVMSHGLPT